MPNLSDLLLRSTIGLEREILLMEEETVPDKI